MTDTTETLSIGQQLKTKREALNLTIEDVAQKTNLKKAHLEAIEDDIFILPNVPPAFVRGYVRNYVRFLRLPEELVGTVNYGEVTIPKEAKSMVAKPIPVKNNQRSQTRWVKGLTWLILLGAVGMTLAWWWQEHKKEQATNAELVSQAAETTSTENAIENSAVEPVPSSTELTIQPAEISNTEANNTVTPSDAVPVTIAQPEVKSKSEPAVAVPVAIETKISATPTTVEPVNVLQQVESEANVSHDTKATEQPQAVGNDELRIEITNSASWITVRGVKNKKLAEKLYNAGEVLTFNGNEQYRLTVGAPANVKIYYKGQQVPLKVDGRVARFKLPLAN